VAISKRDFLTGAATVGGALLLGRTGTFGQGTRRVIDAHTHWYPSEWVELVQKEGEAAGARLGRNDRGGITFNAKGIGAVFSPNYIDLDSRIKSCLRAAHNPHPRADAAALVGRCLERAGLREQAIEAYRACLAIDQGQLLIRVRLGHLLWSRGSVEEAMQEFTKGMPFGCQLANFPDVPRRIEKLSLS
jgi:tetratricopeptide (TPR) repeat protein